MLLTSRMLGVVYFAAALNACTATDSRAENDVYEGCPQDGRRTIEDIFEKDGTDKEKQQISEALEKAQSIYIEDAPLIERLFNYFSNEYFVDGVPTGKLKGLDAGIKAEEMTSHRAEDEWFKWQGSEDLTEMRASGCTDLFVVQVIQGHQKPLYFMCLDDKPYTLLSAYEWKGCDWRRIAE